MDILLILVTVSAGLLGLGLTLPAAALARRAGWVSEPRPDRHQDRAVPLGGGLAILIAFGTVAVGACIASRGIPREALPGTLAAEAGPYLDGILLRIRPLVAILIAAAALGLLGLWDDIRPLRARSKLLGQTAIVTGLYLAIGDEGFRITFFLPMPALWGPATILWLLVLTNAFNFLDNMDGIAAGVAAVAAGLLLVIAYGTGQMLVAAALAALLGALLGFLRWNVPPARVFMGDAGSLPVGFLLAAFTVLCTFQAPGQTAVPAAAAAPLLIFAVPLFDTVTVLWIRLREGRPLAVGDRSHLSHRLVAMGMTERETLGTLMLLTFSLGMLAPTLIHLPPEATHLTGFVVGQTIGILCIIGLIERAGRRS